MKKKLDKWFWIKIICIIGIVIIALYLIYPLCRDKVLLEPYLNKNDYISIQAKPCKYALRGESIEFEITCIEKHLGILSLNDFYVNGASADMDLKKKNKNRYILTLNNIQPNRPEETYKTTETVNGYEYNRGLECYIGIRKQNINKHIESFPSTTIPYYFYIVDNYVYIDEIEHNTITNDVSFDIVYKGDILSKHLDEKSFRLENILANIELYSYKNDINKVRVKLKNISLVNENEKYGIYMTGGTAVGTDAFLSNADTELVDANKYLSVAITRAKNNPLLIIVFSIITAISTLLTAVVSIYELKNFRRIKINEKIDRSITDE